MVQIYILIIEFLRKARSPSSFFFPHTSRLCFKFAHARTRDRAQYALTPCAAGRSAGVINAPECSDSASCWRLPQVCRCVCAPGQTLSRAPPAPGRPFCPWTCQTRCGRTADTLTHSVCNSCDSGAARSGARADAARDPEQPARRGGVFGHGALARSLRPCRQDEGAKRRGSRIATRLGRRQRRADAPAREATVRGGA